MDCSRFTPEFPSKDGLSDEKLVDLTKMLEQGLETDEGWLIHHTQQCEDGHHWIASGLVLTKRPGYI